MGHALTMPSFDLDRFVEAQDTCYPVALAELRGGRKRTHWMWFIFPQLVGLGSSPTARKYGITGLAEARAYASHPVLGPRLVECTKAALMHRGLPAQALFGAVDALKFRSCLTLFARAAPAQPVFEEALDAYFGGQEDPATVQGLKVDIGSPPAQ